MDTIEKLAKFGSTPEWALIAPDLKNSTDPLTHAKGVWSEAQLISTAFDEVATSIKASPDLTATGKQKRLSEVGKAHLESLAKLRAKMTPVVTAQGAAIAKARTATKSTEDMIAGLLIQREIRDLLKEQIGDDPNALKIAYSDAIDAGDYTTCDAIENSPRLWEARPSVPELEEWKAARLEAEEPTLSAEVRDLSAALKDCGNILDDVEADIREVSGIHEDDGMAALTNGPA